MKVAHQRVGNQPKPVENGRSGNSKKDQQIDADIGAEIEQHENAAGILDGETSPQRHVGHRYAKRRHAVGVLFYLGRRIHERRAGDKYLADDLQRRVIGVHGIPLSLPYLPRGRDYCQRPP